MKKYLSILRNSPFFDGMTEAEIISVLQCVDSKVQKRYRDEYIFRASESTQTMGLVLSGSVLVIQEDVWGHRNIMAKITPGDFFAESYAITPGAVLNISVVVNEDAEILMLNMNRLLSVCPASCSHHNRLIRNLVSVLASKVLLFNNKITHMSKRSTRDKLLSYLSSESMRQGKLAFDIPYDRQQLADFLCVERAAMSAELGKLKKDGVLDTKRNHFVLFKSVHEENIKHT